MLNHRLFLAFSTLLFASLSGWAFPDTPGAGSKQLFSPSAGRQLYEIACELAGAENVTPQQAEQAIILLMATTNLDSRANYVLPDMIKIATRYSQRDYSQLVRRSLVNYVDESADLELVGQAVRYLLDQLNSREEREKLLQELLNNLGDRNAGLDSELAAMLGLLMIEKADFETAQSYFMRAFNKNKYNRSAFAKLAELAPEQIGPALYIEQFRLALGENPLNMQAALAFARYAEQLQLYDTAAEAYQYCVDLFDYLYPSQPLPANIYLPWAISNYNTKRNQHRCLQIAEQMRQSGRFDLLLEALAAKAAAKIGSGEQANSILRAAESKARQLAMDPVHSSGGNIQQLAWFYCFAAPDAGKALDQANKAYSMDPNSPTTAAILAYALVINGQTDWARILIDNYQPNQIADLAKAQILLAEGKQNSAIEALKSAIERDPGSLAAERAKLILAEQGGDYFAPTDPDIIMALLRNTVGPAVVPSFITPEKIISAQLNIRGSKFYYDSEFGASVAITNNSSEPLVISDEGLFMGNIRVDADITGDLERKIPNLAAMRVRPAVPLNPGRSLLIPLRLVTGELRNILLNHPQASLEIEFTLYLDPVIDAENNLINRLGDIEPVKVVTKRPGIELTPKFLQNRLNSLSQGRQGQKIRSAKLFAGLLAEQQAMANREPLYRFMYADWMPTMLKSALINNLMDDDWVVKVHTLAAMLSLPLDFDLTSAVAENLTESNWPVRMTAVYLLARNQKSNFAKVLDWTAKYDSSKLVREMAIASGAADPQARRAANQPNLNN